MKFEGNKVFNEYCFENYDQEEDWQKAIYVKAKEYAENHKGKWFYISGQVFSGKTYICVSIVKDIYSREKLTYEYIPFTSELELLKHSKDKSLLNTLKSVDILVIDDLSWYSPKDKDISTMVDIISYRYFNNKICIFASNKSLEEIFKINRSIGMMISRKAKGFILQIDKNPNKNYIHKILK